MKINFHSFASHHNKYIEALNRACNFGGNVIYQKEIYEIPNVLISNSLFKIGGKSYLERFLSAKIILIGHSLFLHSYHINNFLSTYIDKVPIVNVFPEFSVENSEIPLQFPCITYSGHYMTLYHYFNQQQGGNSKNGVLLLTDDKVTIEEILHATRNIGNKYKIYVRLHPAIVSIARKFLAARSLKPTYENFLALEKNNNFKIIHPEQENIETSFGRANYIIGFGNTSTLIECAISSKISRINKNFIFSFRGEQISKVFGALHVIDPYIDEFQPIHENITNELCIGYENQVDCFKNAIRSAINER